MSDVSQANDTVLQCPLAAFYFPVVCKFPKHASLVEVLKELKGL